MVARVIAVDPTHGNSATAFWIERRETCPDHPKLNFGVTWMTDFPLVRGDTPNDRVRDRIAHGECLIEVMVARMRPLLTIVHLNTSKRVRPPFNAHGPSAGAACLGEFAVPQISDTRGSRLSAHSERLSI